MHNKTLIKKTYCYYCLCEFKWEKANWIIRMLIVERNGEKASDCLKEERVKQPLMIKTVRTFQFLIPEDQDY